MLIFANDSDCVRQGGRSVSCALWAKLSERGPNVLTKNRLDSNFQPLTRQLSASDSGKLGLDSDSNR